MKKILFYLALLFCESRATPDTADVFVNLVRFEGYKVIPYRDGNHWVIGVGHSLTGHKETVKKSYSYEEIRNYFLSDYAEALATCRRLVDDFDRLPEPIQLLCLNLVWSVGPTGFSKFKNFRLALKYCAYSTARIELALSKWASQVQPARRDWALNQLKQFTN